VEEASLGDRLDEMRRQIEAHPWQFVGAAALLGAWLGFEPPRVRLRGPSTLRRRIADGVFAAIGALAVRVVREAAFRHVGDLARRWWDGDGSYSELER
jgi:hypothetical protein